MICTDIILPSQAPAKYQDRATLWNAVERAERGKKAQLAYSFDIALQNEFSMEENITLARQFVSEQLVGRGMIADFAVHLPDREDVGIPRLFTNSDVGPLHPNTPYGWLKDFCDRTGQRFLGIHAFRHLSASLLIESGADVRTVSAMLGHSNTSTTLNIYAHSFDEAKARAGEAVGELLGKRKILAK